MLYLVDVSASVVVDAEDGATAERWVEAHPAEVVARIAADPNRIWVEGYEVYECYSLGADVPLGLPAGDTRTAKQIWEAEA
jgi:hypothetical protein